MRTAYGNFDLDPAWNQSRIPYDFGTGPGQFSMNMRVSKSIGIGPKLTETRQRASGSQGGPGGPGGGGPRSRWWSWRPRRPAVDLDPAD